MKARRFELVSAATPSRTFGRKRKKGKIKKRKNPFDHCQEIELRQKKKRKKEMKREGKKTRQME